jgi:hypothetical protein
MANQLVQKKLADMQTEITLGLQCSRRAHEGIEGTASGDHLDHEAQPCGKSLDIARVARDMMGGTASATPLASPGTRRTWRRRSPGRGNPADIHAPILGRAQTGIAASEPHARRARLPSHRALAARERLITPLTRRKAKCTSSRLREAATERAADAFPRTCPRALSRGTGRKIFAGLSVTGTVPLGPFANNNFFQAGSLLTGYDRLRPRPPINAFAIAWLQSVPDMPPEATCILDRSWGTAMYHNGLIGVFVAHPGIPLFPLARRGAGRTFTNITRSGHDATGMGAPGGRAADGLRGAYSRCWWFSPTSFPTSRTHADGGGRAARAG